MDILTMAVGAFATNCYVVVPDGVKDGAECFVIDPGAEGPRIVDALQARGLEPRYVLCTHGHADHTGGVAAIVAEFGAQFGVGAGDVDQVIDPPAWLTGSLTDFVRPPSLELTFKGGEVLEIGGARLEVLATPGHTPGSVCYSVGETVFTGDTLFRQSIGRYDLPGWRTVRWSWLQFVISCSCWMGRQWSCPDTGLRPPSPKSECTTRS